MFSICFFNDFLPSLFLKSSGMIVDGMTDKEKLVWRGRKEASRRKRAMRETKKSIKETGGRRRLKEKAADNCDFQLEGIQQLSLKTCSSAWDILISRFRCFPYNLQIPMFTSNYSSVIVHSGNNIYLKLITIIFVFKEGRLSCISSLLLFQKGMLNFWCSAHR